MSDKIFTSTISEWENNQTPENLATINSALEDGKVLFFPDLSFAIIEDEHEIISPHISDGKAKNISYDFTQDSLSGAIESLTAQSLLKKMLRRYATQSINFLKYALPQYANDLEIGRTSFRPVEIAGRKSPSYKKDDTRLHVDAFPASPNQGKRILRMFTNINAEKPRHWHLGDSFKAVAERFLPHIKPALLGSGLILHKLGITKSVRSAYDHYMLQIHDRMKGDLNYQQSVSQLKWDFPAQSSWVVFTDQVSHAAISGQHVLEQTFYLPIDAMQDSAKAPLKILEEILAKKLT